MHLVLEPRCDAARPGSAVDDVQNELSSNLLFAQAMVIAKNELLLRAIRVQQVDCVEAVAGDDSAAVCRGK
jgi:hypothetical protein